MDHQKFPLYIFNIHIQVGCYEQIYSIFVFSQIDRNKNKTKSKVFSLERLHRFYIKKNSQEKFQKIVWVRKKKFCLKKNLGSTKNFGSRKILVQKSIWKQ